MTSFGFGSGFLKHVLPYNPGWPETHYISQDTIEISVAPLIQPLNYEVTGMGHREDSMTTCDQ